MRIYRCRFFEGTKDKYFNAYEDIIESIILTWKPSEVSVDLSPSHDIITVRRLVDGSKVMECTIVLVTMEARNLRDQ